MLSVLPHQQSILVPFEMKPRGRNAVRVLHPRIDVDKIRIAPLGGRLDIKTDRSGIAALDLAFVIAAESFNLVKIPGKLGAAAVRVDGISANEFLLVRIVEILPARHPGYRAG